MAETQKSYPKARIAMENGDLMQVTDFKVSTDNSAKMVPTIRVPEGAGVVTGSENTTVSFNYVIDGDGAERDYITALKRGKVKQIRAKVAGETLTITGKIKMRSIEQNIDDPTKGSVEFVGRLDG